MNTKNKSDLIRIQLAKDIIVKHLKGEKQLAPIKEYADQFKVGTGTVQAAINDLKTAGAIKLDTRGAQGSFLEKVDKKKLWKISEYGPLVGLFPLDKNLEVKALATGIYESFTHYDLPIHILFSRGSGNRVDMLLRGKCDFIVMSELAYQHAIYKGKALIKICEVGTWSRQYGVLALKGKKLDSSTTIAYDRHSYEQEALIWGTDQKEHAYGQYLGVQLLEIIRSGQAEAGLFNSESLNEVDDKFEFHLIDNISPDTKAALDKMVLVVAEKNKSIAELMSILCSWKGLHTVQQAVLRGERFVEY